MRPDTEGSDAAMEFVPRHPYAIPPATGPDDRLPGGAVVRRLGPLSPSPFNIVIAGRAARTSTHDRRFRIRCLEAVLWCDPIEIGRGNVSTHVERAAPDGHLARQRFGDAAQNLQEH